MKYQNKSYPILVVAIILSLGMIAFSVYKLNRMPASLYPGIHGEFSLHSVDGPVASRDLQGKVGLIYFGYTHCPDVCPATLLNIGAALKLLTPDELTRVMPVFITTDPDRDSPASMAKYIQNFDSHIMGLSGSTEEISTAMKSFRGKYKKDAPDSKGNYTVTHVSHIIIIRPDGQVAEFMSHTSKPEEIATAIRHWLRWA